MEALATDAGKEPLALTKSVNEMVRSGYLESEAHEMQTAKISFPHIKQEMWPIARADKIPGQQYHLTQLPFDVETDEKTRFSLIYNILLQFDKPQTCYKGKDIISITKVRLDMMKMELGNIVQPIAPLCSTRGDKAWNGMIKVHLMKPEVDGVALLEGMRVFALALDGKLTVAKTAKGFFLTTPPDQLSTKITSDFLGFFEPHTILSKIIKDSFWRGLEFEIMQVQKTAGETHAFITAASPVQREKILKFQVAIDGELLTPIATRPTRLTEQERTKHNCLVLIVRNINRAKTITEVEAAFQGLIDINNIANIYFPSRDEQLHGGTANVEVTTPMTYKQFVAKHVKMLNHYVKFTPHPHNLDGLATPSEAHLKEFSFTDINNTLAEMVEALRNAPNSKTTNQVTKAEIATMVEEAIKERNKTLKCELLTDMQEIKDNIIKEVNNYTRTITNELKGKLD